MKPALCETFVLAWPDVGGLARRWRPSPTLAPTSGQAAQAATTTTSGQAGPGPKKIDKKEYLQKCLALVNFATIIPRTANLSEMRGLITLRQDVALTAQSIMIYFIMVLCKIHF